MSDVNKIVAAILSTARISGSGGPYSVDLRIQDYQACLKALNALGDQDEPKGPDINAIKDAIIETLDRVGKK